MELYGYQQQALATVTEDGRAFQLDYLIPGIVGETGELFGQRAKAVWHGWSAAQLKEELVSEYGDIAWMTAVLLHTKGVHHLTFQRDEMNEFARTKWGNKLDPWHILGTRAQYLYMYSTEAEQHQYVQGAAVDMWLALHQYCEEITGAPFEGVLAANLTKLAGRAQRGTLVGAGDHR